MHFWLSVLRPRAGFFAGLILLTIFGCTKTSKRKGVVSVAATTQQNRTQTTSLDVGSTTKDTPGACRARSKKDESEEADDESADDDSDDEASELRLAGAEDSEFNRQPSVNVGGNSIRAAEDAESIVSRQCKSCHSGSASTANTNQGGNRGGILGRFGRNNNNNVIRSSIKFGGRDDLEVRANDIIEEFENPGRQHSSITNPDAVVKAFEDLKKAKERRLEKQANNCI